MSAWKKDGDEWTDQAAFCKQPYEAWKASLIDTFIKPNATGKIVLEIGFGHGRWTESLISVAKQVFAVDIFLDNATYCRKKFLNMENVRFLVNDGYTIPSQTPAIDFVWSYDSFVHFKPEDIYSYLKEMKRLLVPGGIAIIHHASNGGVEGGGRSYMTRHLLTAMLDEVGLNLMAQTDSWGNQHQYNCRLFGDCISTIQSLQSKP